MDKSVFIFNLQSPYAEVGGELPTEFRLFAYGQNRAYKMGSGDKEIPFSRKDADKLSSAFIDAGVELLIDYEHQSLDGITGPKSAAGWIKALDVRDDGIYATSVEWTPKAAEMLKNKEYKYFSPAVEFDEDGEMCRMLPAALTNLPALKGIQKLMNSIVENANKDNNMSDEKTVETFNAAEALSQIKTMKEEVEKLRKEKTDMEVNAILDRATAEGRLAPAKRAELFSQVEAIGVSGLKFIVNSLEPAVKPAVSAPAETGTAPAELSDLEKSLAQSIGVSLEAFSAQKKKTAGQLAAAKAIGNDLDPRKHTFIDQTKSKEAVRTLTVLTASKSEINIEGK